MEGLRHGAPGPVTLTDVTFREPAASGRGGFLLARRDTVSAVTMVGGKVAVAHPHREFGNLSQANRVLTATGTGASPWTLTGTELVLEGAALVETSRLARFSGRVSAGDRAYTAGLAVAYPGTLAAVEALQPASMGDFALLVRRYDALLLTLDNAGVLAKLDALHVFATGNEAAARINLAEPSRGPLFLAGSGAAPTFAADRGYTGAGASGQYLRSTLIASTQDGRYHLDSATMGIVNRTGSGNTVSRDVSLNDGLGNALGFVDPYSDASGTGTAKYVSRANDTTNTASAISGATGPVGFYAWSRITPSGYVKYRGLGTAAAPTTEAIGTTTTGSLSGATFDILRGGSHQVSATFFGAGLTDAEMTALYAALKTSLTAVGTWV